MGKLEGVCFSLSSDMKILNSNTTEAGELKAGNYIAFQSVKPNESGDAREYKVYAADANWQAIGEILCSAPMVVNANKGTVEIS